MKKTRLIQNLILVLSINLAWFFTTYYQHRMDGSYSIADVVFDLIFTAIFLWILVIVFAKSQSLFSQGAFQLGENGRTVLVKWIALIAAKCVFDVAIRCLGSAFAEWKNLVNGLLSASFLLIAYAVLVQKDLAIWKNKRRLFVVSALVLLILAIGVCYDLYQINQIHLLAAKYRENSPPLLRSCKNIDFLSSIKTFIVDMAILLLFVVCHLLHAPLAQSEQQGKCNVMQLFIRCDIILVAALALCLIKVALDPQGVLLITGTAPSTAQNFQQEGPFNLTVEGNMVLYGFDIEPSADNSYYYTETIRLEKEGCASQLFHRNGSEPSFVLTSEGEQNGEYVAFAVGERKVYLYGHYAICYYENGTEPRIIRMDTLDQLESNTVVTELCKHLLEEGNLFVFEYAGKYLAKYEPEFIQPYIDRYRNGVFNSAEIQFAEEVCYRNDYIVNLARQLL